MFKRLNLTVLVLSIAALISCSGCGGGGGGGAQATSRAAIDGVYVVTTTLVSDECDGGAPGQSDTTTITIESVDGRTYGNVRICDEQGRILVVGTYSATNGKLTFTNSVEIGGVERRLDSSDDHGTIQFAFATDADKLTFTGNLTHIKTELSGPCIKQEKVVGFMLTAGPPVVESLPLFAQDQLIEGEVLADDTAQHSNQFDAFCAGVGNADCAFLFEAEEAGQYRFTTDGSLWQFDTILAAYELDQDSPAALIDCDDAPALLPSDLVVVLGQHQRILVVVDGGFATAPFAESTGYFTLSVEKVERVVLYRVNCGGPEIPAIDGGPAWSADTDSSPSPFLSSTPSASLTTEFSWSTAAGDASVPTEVPNGIFHSERYDPLDSVAMQWSFPVAPGSYEVRLYFAENYVSAPGERFFGVWLNWQIFLEDFDIVAAVGAGVGTLRSTTIVVEDGYGLELYFNHVIENPLVCGIEIVQN